MYPKDFDIFSGYANLIKKTQIAEHKRQQCCVGSIWAKAALGDLKKWKAQGNLETTMIFYFKVACRVPVANLKE